MKFIEQSIKHECDKFKKNHTVTIMRKFYDSDRSQTNHLATTRTYVASANKLTFTAPIYLRFQDMRKTLTKSGRMRPVTKVYNTYVYGIYYSLVDTLMFGLTEEVRLQIKSQWQK